MMAIKDQNTFSIRVKTGLYQTRGKPMAPVTRKSVPRTAVRLLSVCCQTFPSDRVRPSDSAGLELAEESGADGGLMGKPGGLLAASLGLVVLGSMNCYSALTALFGDGLGRTPPSRCCAD